MYNMAMSVSQETRERAQAAGSFIASGAESSRYSPGLVGFINTCLCVFRQKDADIVGFLDPVTSLLGDVLRSLRLVKRSTRQ